MLIFESDDISINYQITGAGPRVLFFNGSGATLKGSELLLRSLSKECEVLAHDQRGLGLTSIPEGPYTMAQYASDAAALLDHVGWDTCVVVGISFGGMVAQEFAVTFPDRVERLALLCTTPSIHTALAQPYVPGTHLMIQCFVSPSLKVLPAVHT